MTEAEIHRFATWAEIAFAIITVLLLSFITAPYGRHERKGWGPTMSNRWGWVLMELPAVAVFVPLYFIGTKSSEWAPLFLLALWQAHYFHRTLIFPFRLKTKGKRVALIIILLGMTFNSLNAYVNARQLSEFGTYPVTWLLSPQFLIGTVLFAVGYIINRHADRTLLRLRAPGESGYKIPHGGLYKFVSCPNYLGEIIEWTGFAIATWSLPGLAFALYTLANVGPRALSNHKWYQEKFSDYPSERRALIPFLL